MRLLSADIDGSQFWHPLSETMRCVLRTTFHLLRGMALIAATWTEKEDSMQFSKNPGQFLTMPLEMRTTGACI